MIGILLSRFCSFRIYKFFDYTINIDNYVDIFASGIFYSHVVHGQQKIENWTPIIMIYYTTIVRLSRIGDVIVSI
jgi:hypothetical protein